MSILVTIFQKFRIWSKFLKNIDFSPKLRNISILVEVFEKCRICLKFEKTSILEEIVGKYLFWSMGSHWVQKMGKNHEKITMPQNSNFRLLCGHRFFPKNGSYGYGAKSRWGTLGFILGPVGSTWVKKNGSKL